MWNQTPYFGETRNFAGGQVDLCASVKIRVGEDSWPRATHNPMCLRRQKRASGSRAGSDGWGDRGLLDGAEVTNEGGTFFVCVSERIA